MSERQTTDTLLPRTAGQKQARTAIYDSDGQTLFVPLEAMYSVHDAAKVARQAGETVSQAELFRRALPTKSRHTAEVTLAHWRKLFGAHAWFKGWLLAGEDPGPGIHVPPLDTIRLCRKVWDYMAICRLAGIREITYYRWTTGPNKFLPTLAWLQWLYGGKAPDGVFVVTANLQKLRDEKLQGRICQAAGVGQTSLQRWRTKPTLAEALHKAKEIGSSGGTCAELANKYGPWNALHTKLKKHIWAFAIAATLRECCRRAGIGTKTYYALLHEAKLLGVTKDLLRYLESKERAEDGTNFRSCWIGEHLFIPTRAMLRFRAEVVERMNKGQFWRSLKNAPGVLEWFRDWTVPLKAGRREMFATKRNGSPVQRAETRTQTTRKRGRKIDPRTEEVLKFCYERRRAGKKSPVIRREAEKIFRSHAPKEDSTVILYARRYADRYDLPL